MSQIPLFEKKVDPEKPKEKSLPSNVGAWQKVWSDEFSECMQYTTGFGEKFMRKLGFDGRLGKDGQVIAQPIATKVRNSLIQ